MWKNVAIVLLVLLVTHVIGLMLGCSETQIAIALICGIGVGILNKLDKK